MLSATRSPASSRSASAASSPATPPPAITTLNGAVGSPASAGEDSEFMADESMHLAALWGPQSSVLLTGENTDLRGGCRSGVRGPGARCAAA